MHLVEYPVSKVQWLKSTEWHEEQFVKNRTWIAVFWESTALCQQWILQRTTYIENRRFTVLDYKRRLALCKKRELPQEALEENKSL